MGCEKTAVKLSCAVLKVSRSGFTKWIKKPEGMRKLENANLVLEIKKSHEESRGAYGLPRIHKTLQQKGLKHEKARCFMSF